MKPTNGRSREPRDKKEIEAIKLERERRAERKAALDARHEAQLNGNGSSNGKRKYSKFDGKHRELRYTIVDNSAIHDPEVRGVLDDYGVSKRFPDEVETTAHQAAIPPSEHPQDWENQGFTDFTHLETIIIDPEGAKDHDDAISIEKHEDGSWTSYVHIANVAHYVEAGGTIDKEARRRGTSIYIPGNVIPMLPEVLSNDVCSLKPNHNRFAITHKMDFDADGVMTGYEPIRSVVRVDHGYTYGDVTQLHMEQQSPQILADLRALATLVDKKKKQDGMLEFDAPEAKITLCPETGRVADINAYPRDFSNDMIALMMISANEGQAQWKKEQGLSTIYRTHDHPTEQGIKGLSGLLKAWDIEHDITPETFTGKKLNDLFIEMDPQIRKLLSPQAVRKMTRAVYSTDNTGHFGLASDAYSHSTSPIRRYPDLRDQQVTNELLRTGEIEKFLTNAHRSDMAQSATQSTSAEETADTVSRKVNKGHELNFMEDAIEKKSVFTGYIREIHRHNMDIVLPNTIKGKIPYANLAKNGCPSIDEHRKSVFIGGQTYRLGDEVEVMVDNVYRDKKREGGFIEFDLIS